MKRLFLTSFLLFSFYSYSQFKFGPKIGIAVANTKQGSGFSYSQKFDNVTSITFGAFAEYRIRHFALNAELSYIEGGYKYRYTLGEFGGEPPFDSPSELNVKSVNLYIIPKYYILKKLSLNAGGYFGKITDVNLNILNPNGYNVEDFKTDFTDDYSSIDYGIVFGSSFDIYKGLFVDARYSIGLKDITYRKDSKARQDFELSQTFSGGPDEGDFSLKNRNLVLSIGYKF